MYFRLSYKSLSYIKHYQTVTHVFRHTPSTPIFVRFSKKSPKQGVFALYFPTSTPSKYTWRTNRLADTAQMAELFESGELAIDKGASKVNVIDLNTESQRHRD